MRGRIVACVLSLMVLSACNYTSTSNPAANTPGKTLAVRVNSAVPTVTSVAVSDPATDSSATTQAPGGSAAATTADLAKPKTAAQAAINAEAMASQAEADAAAIDTATP